MVVNGSSRRISGRVIADGEDVEPPGQASAAEVCRFECVARSQACVEWFGRCAELPLDPGGQADSGTQRPRCGGSIETDQPGNSRVAPIAPHVEVECQPRV
jgi:hypothetical protein